MEKLKEWYGKILARDFLASLREKNKMMLSKCTDALEEFCDKVYNFTNKA